MQSQPTPRRILFSALAALTIGLGAISVIAGFSDSFAVRLLQGIAVFAAGAVIVGGAVVLAMIRLAGWHDPESETDFEALVLRTERLGGHPKPGAVERGHGDLEALVDVTNQVLVGDLHVLEDRLTRGRATNPELVLELAHAEPGPVGLDHERADPS